jgi:hypothetical protein
MVEDDEEGVVVGWVVFEEDTAIGVFSLSSKIVEFCGGRTSE